MSSPVRAAVAPGLGSHTRVALNVQTVAVEQVGDLLPFADPTSPLVWIRRGQGFVGIGEALRLEFTGADRFGSAARAWADVVAGARVRDEVEVPGTGLIALGTFAFADGSATSSVLIVPRVVIGRRGDTCWMTRIERVDADDDTARAHGDPDAVFSMPPISLPPVSQLPEGSSAVSLVPGSQSGHDFTAAVARAVASIHAGDLGKVVLARDLSGRMPAGADVRHALSNLVSGYPECWSFGVDGLLGASPETLVSVRAGAVSARVLAGTFSRGADAATDHAAARTLSTSPKDLEEHGFAVRSVLAALRSHTRTLVADDPFTLKLPNLWHLATDVRGSLADGSSSLDLVAALHPTAAVAGTPTDQALHLIQQLEPFDRGRYAGPVGWMNAAGDGEWAIALRCAQRDGDTLTAYAGCGIVADSDPERELAETAMKFRPIVEAFGR